MPRHPFRSLLLTVSLCLAAACEPEQLSVGEPPCGSADCQHELIPLRGDWRVSFSSPGLANEIPETGWAWTHDIDCGDADQCDAHRLELHADGTLTVLAQSHFGDGRGGPVILRFDADGKALGVDASLELNGFQRRAVLSPSGERGTLLARAVIPSGEGPVRVEVYRIRADATPELLFEDTGMFPDAVLEQGDDIVIAGPAVDASGRTGADSRTDVRRYDQDGVRLFRQAGLRRQFSVWDEDRQYDAIPTRIAPAPDGGVYVVTQGLDQGPAGLALVSSAGQVVWQVETWLSADVGLLVNDAGLPVMIGMVDEDLSQRVIGVSGLDGYMLMSLDPEDPGALLEISVRMRNAYYDSTPEAYAPGPNGDVYVATLTGVLAERTSVIDRLDAALNYQESWVLGPTHPEELTEVDGALLTSTGTTYLSDVRDLRVSPAGGVFVLVAEQGLGSSGDSLGGLGGLASARPVLGKLE